MTVNQIYSDMDGRLITFCYSVNIICEMKVINEHNSIVRLKCFLSRSNRVKGAVFDVSVLHPGFSSC